MTILLKVNPTQPESEFINKAAQVILSGGLVAFPTETVYGLGVNAMAEKAVKRLYEVKGRPAVDPLIVHLADSDDLESVVTQVTDLAKILVEAFWPGPLTLIQGKRSDVPSLVTAGLETLAVRVPAHPVALALLQAAGVPVAAPSANLFGQSSPTKAEHVLKDLGGLIEVVLDGGPATIGVESTVLDLTTTPPAILRPGGVTREELEEVIGPVVVREQAVPDGTAQKSPGMLAKHYAPRAELILCCGLTQNQSLSKMLELAQDQVAAGKRVGLLVADEDISWFSGIDVLVMPLGSRDDSRHIAHSLYAAMRTLDEQGVDLILARDFGTTGLGLAIRDRLLRAATQVV